MVASADFQALVTNDIARGYATVSSSAVAISSFTGLAAALIARANVAKITARTAGVMYLTTGNDPTATVGHLIAQNATVEIVGQNNIANLKVIREASTDSEVTITLSE